jgi:hypothetical protein
LTRKTLTKIDRGEDLKEGTLQKLANKLRVPVDHFYPRANGLIDQEDSQPEGPMLRKLDWGRFVDLFGFSERVHWHLNVHKADVETIVFLERFEIAVNDYLQDLNGPDADGNLKQQLESLKKTEKLRLFLEEMPKHRLAILGANYLYWDTHGGSKASKEQQPSLVRGQSERGFEYGDSDRPCIFYESSPRVVLSIEEHPAHERRAEFVPQGTLPPKYASDFETVVRVNGRLLETDPAVVRQHEEMLQEVMQRRTDSQTLSKATFSALTEDKRASNSGTSSEEGSDQ